MENSIESPSPLSEDPRLQLIVDSLQSKQAVDILVMDLRTLSDVADFFVVCSSTSDLHARALSGDLVDTLKTEGHRPWHVEGLDQRRWILVDLVDIVIHIFRSDAMEFYSLERLWGDAPVTVIEESADFPSRAI